MIDRRTIIGSGIAATALAAAPAFSAKKKLPFNPTFPKGFI